MSTLDGFVVSDNCCSKKSEKVIIDTDPGIDDSMAILMAFQSPDLDILGLTTVFGNVTTEDATRNALLLCEIAGRPDVPVAEGSFEPLKRGEPRIADFVHGSKCNFSSNILPSDMHLEQLRKSGGRHAQFICDMCKFYRDWHVKSDGVYGISLHDPVSFVALVRPDLFTFRKGVVRVETQDVCVGHTRIDNFSQGVIDAFCHKIW